MRLVPFRPLWCTLGKARKMSTRTYKDAIECLNSLQSNAAAIDAMRAANARRLEVVIPEALEYLGRIGYTPKDLNKLNVVHIAGTKGKGSTSAFTESIIRHSNPNLKVGLYTSPHIVAVRERIRINGTPLPEEDFTKFFFEVWDKLERNSAQMPASMAPKPMYFRFLTLVAFHTFLSLKVDATVLEVGLGGNYDCTNIVPKPVVTGVTSLGLDHVAILGKTIREIAWQKAGILKEGVQAFTVDQPEDGLEVIEQRAKELKASSLTVVQTIPEISDVQLGIAGLHQRRNASLAVHLARAFLRSDGPLLSEQVVNGLKNTKWPGRCQKVSDPKSPKITWFLDGAHTVESLECCMEWFCSPNVGLRSPRDRVTRVLIFNCTSDRSGGSFLASMLATATARLQLHGQAPDPGFFDHVIFCTNVTYADGHSKGDLMAMALSSDQIAALVAQKQFASAWQSLVPAFPTSGIHVVPSIEHAVNIIRELNDHSIEEIKNVDVLVAGSLHLVGGLIEAAQLADIAL